MSPMPRALLTVAAVLLVALAIALVGETLKLGSPYYLVAFVIGLFLVSLTDRDRFYARDLRSHQ